MARKNYGGGILLMEINIEKIWIYGAVASWHYESQIQFGNINDIFTLHTDADRTNFALVYDFPVTKATIFQISAYTENRTGVGQYFHYVYYLGDDHLSNPKLNHLVQPNHFHEVITLHQVCHFPIVISFLQVENLPIVNYFQQVAILP